MDHILNLTLIFYSISSVLIIFYLFPKTSSVTGKNISTNPETSSCILSQYLWFNKFIIVDNSYVNFTNFSTKNVNFNSDLANKNSNCKIWETLKNKYQLDKLYFQWTQLIQAIPLIWEQKINDSSASVETHHVVQDHHLIKSTRVITTIVKQYTNFPKMFQQTLSK